MTAQKIYFNILLFILKTVLIKSVKSLLRMKQMIEKFSTINLSSITFVIQGGCFNFEGNILIR